MRVHEKGKQLGDPRVTAARRLEDRRDGGRFAYVAPQALQGAAARLDAMAGYVYQPRRKQAHKDQRPDVSVKPLILLLNFGGP